MTFKVQGEITVNGAQAKAEVAAVSGELKKAATETTGFAKAGTQAAQAGQALKAAAGGAAGGVSTVAAQAQQAAANFVRMGDSAKLSAGAVGNLTAQFNDIGMMMAAGQNPLMLAIQQGTQISQVIGPMGAAGAVRALGSAFLALLSPVNLVTLGVIAGSAALVNWMTAAEDGADRAGAALEDLRAGWAEVSAQLEKLEAFQFPNLDGMKGTAADVRREFETILTVVNEVAARDLQMMLQDRLGETTVGLQDAIRTGLQEADIAGRMGQDAPAFEYQGLDSLYEAQTVLRVIHGIEGDTREEMLLSVQAASERLMLQGLLTTEVQASLAAIFEELGGHEAITAETERRVEAERAAWEYVVALKEDLFAAASANLAAVFTDATGPAAQVLGFVNGIIGRMQVMVQQAQAQARLKEIAFENSPGGQALMKYGGRGTAVDTPVTDGRGFQLVEGQFVDPNAPRITSGSAGVGGRFGGGGGGAARAEADAVGTLIEKLRAEVEVSRELDPIAKEMLRYRTQLKDATEEERAAVEALIAQREREKATMASMEFVSDAAGNAMIDALMGASDAGEKLIDTLKRAVLQAVLLGEGPLGGLLGGGIFKGLFGGGGEAAPPGFARGGWTGSGATTDVAGVVHAEEYVFDAAATRRIGVANLEALRRAARRGYRSGGFVTDGRPVVRDSGGARSGDEAARRAVFEINVSGTGNSEIRAGVHEAIRAAFDEYSNRQLPGLVRMIQTDRWGD